MRMIKYAKGQNSPKSARRGTFRGGVTLKILSIAALAACISVQSGVKAADLSATTLGDDNSAYTLTKVDKQGENTITKYEYDPAAGTMTPVYYRVDLKQTTYGSGDDLSYYEWSQNEEGNYELYKTETPAEGKITITAPMPNTLEDLNNLGPREDDLDADPTAGIVDSASANDYYRIWNMEGTIGTITGDFVNRWGDGKDGGGAISNVKGSIGDITGNFIGNHIGTYYYYLCYTDNNPDGAFRGYGRYNSTTGEYENYYDHFDNFYDKTNQYYTWDDDTKQFYYLDDNNEKVYVGNSYSNLYHWFDDGMYGELENYGSSYYNTYYGRADGERYRYDYNYNNDARGGAIHNATGTINNITGNFIGNYVMSRPSGIGSLELSGAYSEDDRQDIYASGGAIFNNLESSINNITGDFIGNWASGRDASGGAIYNSTSTINSITGDFIGNYAEAPNVTVEEISGAGYKENNWQEEDKGGSNSNTYFYYSYDSDEGRYYRYTYAGKGNGSYSCYQKVEDGKGNYTYDEETGYTYVGYNMGNYNKVTPYEDENGDFSREWQYEQYYAHDISARGGAISNYEDSTIGSIEGSFIGNYVRAEDTGTAYGGAIYNAGTIGTADDDGNVTGGGIINSSFYNNYAKSESAGEAKGGAVYTTKDLTFVSDAGATVFSGNYTDNAGEIDDNAIYLDSSDAALNFELKNNGIVIMNDNIRGEDGYKVNIKGDSLDTTFYMFNDMYNANLSAGNTTINTINNAVHVYDVNSFTLTGDTNMAADVDLKNETMDRFTANEYGEHTGTLTVTGMNLLSDTTKDSVAIYFAETGLKDNVADNSLDVPGGNQTTAYTPIYKYNVLYDNRDDAGYFVFAKGDKILDDAGDISGSTGNPSDAFNPAVLASPVATTAAAQATINETFHYVFEHADAFTQFPLMERIAKIDSNKYAIASTDFNQNLGSFNYVENNKGVWLRPYTMFETLDLKNGPKVDAINYGTLIGYDGDFKEGKHGWHRVGTGYLGYNGSQLNYSGVDTSMNGGLLGFTETFYKDNFWSAVTLAAGASAGENRTMYGKDDFSVLMAGVGSKTGYNFEFKEGRYILQPIMFLSYTFVDTFDYTNAAGVSIKNSPAHSIQLNPNVRFIANLKNGWQPYASVGMVWNVFNDNKTIADNVRLPEMSIKPYVEYGVGVQRQWEDKYTGFLQAMVRNGGRTGVALTAGFRWAFGDSGKSKNKNVDNESL